MSDPDLDQFIHTFFAFTQEGYHSCLQLGRPCAQRRKQTRGVPLPEPCPQDWRLSSDLCGSVTSLLQNPFLLYPAAGKGIQCVCSWQRQVQSTSHSDSFPSVPRRNGFRGKWVQAEEEKAFLAAPLGCHLWPLQVCGVQLMRRLGTKEILSQESDAVWSLEIEPCS